MYNFTFEKPKEDETEEDIVMHNLKVSDELFVLEYFIMSQAGWFNLQKNKDANANYYNFEKFLRDNNFNTHLFARKPGLKLNKEVNLLYPNTKSDNEKNKEIKYECIYSCRPKKQALEDVLKNWKSYEENLEALKISGFLSINSESDICTNDNSDSIKLLPKNEIDNSQLIGKNKLKIIATYVSIQETLSDVIKNIKKETGKDPTQELFAMYPDGSPVFGFVVNNEIVSNIGYSIHYVEKSKNVIEKAISIVDLTKITK